MIARIVLLSSALLVALIGIAEAEELSLPVGEWGHSSNHGVDCNPPFLKIEQNRIIKRLGGGEGRCPIKKIKKEGRYIMVDVTCVYNKSITPEYLIEGDGDDDSFSLIVKGPTEILLNNSSHKLCKVNPGGAR